MVTPGWNFTPLIRTGVFGGPDDGVMVNSVFGRTVRDAVPNMLDDVAVMVVVPVPWLVVSPVLEIVATEVFDDDHVALAVRS
jgi:hypothetical protein